jgi:hypothetical protein
MSKRNRNTEHDAMQELLLAKRDELNTRIEQRRQEIVMDQEPEDEVRRGSFRPPDKLIALLKAKT